MPIDQVVERVMALIRAKQLGGIAEG